MEFFTEWIDLRNTLLKLFTIEPEPVDFEIFLVEFFKEEYFPVYFYENCNLEILFEIKMAPIGRLDVFDETTENVESYFMRVNAFFAINAVTDGNRVNALISVLGSKVFDELCSLCSPDLPTAKTYDDLKTLLITRYRRSHLASSQRHQLSLRKQKEGESVSQFVSQLHIMARTCAFSTRASLEEVLLQNLLNNLRDTRIQEKLLTQAGLTLDAAVQQANSYESIFMQLDAAKAASNPRSADGGEVFALNSNHQHSGAGAWNPCYRCGRNHVAENCPVATWSCRVCNKVGHIARMCLVSRPSHFHRGGRGVSHGQHRQAATSRGSSGGSHYQPQQQQRGGGRARWSQQLQLQQGSHQRGAAQHQGSRRIYNVDWETQEEEREPDYEPVGIVVCPDDLGCV